MGSAGLFLPLLLSAPLHACSDGRLCRGTVYKRRENGLFTQQYNFMAVFDSNTCKGCEKIPSSELIWDFLEEKLGKTDLSEMPVTSRLVSS